MAADGNGRPTAAYFWRAAAMADRPATIPRSRGRRWAAWQCPSQLETIRRDGGAAMRTGGARQWGDGGAATAIREAMRQGEMEMERGRTGTGVGRGRAKPYVGGSNGRESRQRFSRLRTESSALRSCCFQTTCIWKISCIILDLKNAQMRILQ
ncbi:unnamed protein product [Miscanthus lutarioriparius]|uniref:Uncharacterized protein n=1 Tax=Miscanthus lutarioriparius TaxID=422564 RepID=A0A811ML40_9POAL|nr:unnamed protein product [Miscanthus lutarioriparius]